jgi:hypothetical protein
VNNSSSAPIGFNVCLSRFESYAVSFFTGKGGVGKTLWHAPPLSASPIVDWVLLVT